MSTSAMADVDLFTALHRALAELRELDQPGERRGSQRRDFRCVQLLAPFDGSFMPAQTDYAVLPFYDLSPSGFSYLADCSPQTRQVIAALGKTPFQFFTADVVQERRVNYQGQTKLLIGCRFTGRL